MAAAEPIEHHHLESNSGSRLTASWFTLNDRAVLVGRRPNLALVTNYYPDRRPLSEYGFHLARGLRQGDNGDLSVLSGRATAPSNGALRVWTYGSVLIPFEIERALLARAHDAVLFNTIFTNWGGNLTNLAGMLAPLFAKRRGLKVMTLLHHLPQTIDAHRAGYRLTLLHSLAIELACRAVAAASDVVCFTLQRDLEYFRNRYHARRVTLVPLGLQGAPEWRPPPGGAARILTFGKWGRGKDPEPAIRAFLHTNLGGELVVAGGSTPTRAGFIEKLARQYASDNIIFTGYVPESRVPGLFQNAHIVIFPYRETTGSSAVLYQTCQFGRVPILRRLPVFEQMVRELDIVAYFYDSEDDLERLLPALLSDRARLIEVGQANLSAVQHLTMDTVGKVYWRLLDESGAS